MTRHLASGDLSPASGRATPARASRNDLPRPSPEMAAAGRDSARPASQHDPVHPLDIAATVARHARQSPDRLAVVCRTQAVSYAELWRACDALALSWQEAGLAAADRVALTGPRGVDQVLTCLAIARCQATVAVIDDSLPRRRREFMLRDLAPRLVVDCDDRHRSEAGGHALHWANPRGKKRVAATAHREIDAYIVYTSGSTGTAKGVCVPYRCLDHLISWQVERSISRPRTLQYSAPGFDVFQQEWLSTLGAGGTLLIPADCVRRDPAALADYMRDEEVQRVFMPYAGLQAFASLAQSRHLPRLVEVITAGERLVVTPAIRALFARNPQASLTNQYGPSETHVVSSYTLTGSPGSWPVRPAIGVAVPGSDICVLDPESEAEVGDREVGEIVAFGDCLATGYLNQPDLTARKFPTLATALGPRRGYRTGDRGWVADGVLHFEGRVDDQVKIRGYRVELGEIDTALSALPGVHLAAGVVERGSSGDRLVGALVLTSEARDADLQTLREQLTAVLPAYAVPARLVALPGLPLTSTGKVDRRLVSSQILDPRAGATLTPDERTVGDLFVDVLGCEVPGASLDFLAVGGQSLEAAQLSLLIRDRTSVEISATDVLETRTVSGLAELIARRRHQAADRTQRPEESPAQPAERIDPLQLPLWVHNQTRPADTSYTTALLIERPGVSADAMVSAWQVLQARYPHLGVRFERRRGTIHAVTLPSLPLPSRLTLTANTVRELVNQRLDVATGPCVAMYLDERAGHLESVLIVGHHIVLDGWSTALLVDELQVALLNKPLPPVAPPHHAPARPEDWSWWRGSLSATALPATALSVSGESLTGAADPDQAQRRHVETAELELTAQESGLAQQRARTGHATLLAHAMASLAQALGSAAPRVIGTPLARQALTPTCWIGHATDLLPVLIPSTGADSAQMQRAMLEAMAHSSLSFHEVTRLARGRRDAGSRNPWLTTTVQVDDALWWHQPDRTATRVRLLDPTDTLFPEMYYLLREPSNWRLRLRTRQRNRHEARRLLVLWRQRLTAVTTPVPGSRTPGYERPSSDHRYHERPTRDV